MFPSSKHESKSVPPEIDARWTFFLIFLYTYSNPSFDKGDPVEQIVFSFFSDNYDVRVLMTFTAPNCPVAESLPIEIRGEIEKIESRDIKAAIFDLGYSTDQIFDQEKGLSFNSKGKLNMRMGLNSFSAHEVINKLNKDELTKIFKFYFSLF